MSMLQRTRQFIRGTSTPVVSLVRFPSGKQQKDVTSARPCKRQKLLSDTFVRHAAREDTEVTSNIDSTQESTALQIAEQSFHTISLDGCEVLIGSDADDRLILSNIFVQDHETGVYAEPELIGDIPQIAQRYAEVNWTEEFIGDTLNSEPGWKKVLKVYLVKISQEEPFRLDLEEIYSIDSTDRSLQREEVLWLTEERDPRLITLRIRPEGLYIEANEEMISDYHLVEYHLIEQEEARVAALKEKTNLDTPVMMEEGPRDPIDALNDDEREYDETMEDTPSVDQGF